MKTEHIEVGRSGETVAKQYLQKNGYSIVEENHKTKYAEIDLIVRDKGVLVFVEVRAKSGELFGTPEDSITRNKIRKLIKNANAYVVRKNYNESYRIDVVCIIFANDKKVKRISHYKNITS